MTFCAIQFLRDDVNFYEMIHEKFLTHLVKSVHNILHICAVPVQSSKALA